jgi:hypothetical protein
VRVILILIVTGFSLTTAEEVGDAVGASNADFGAGDVIGIFSTGKEVGSTSAAGEVISGSDWLLIPENWLNFMPDIFFLVISSPNV